MIEMCFSNYDDTRRIIKNLNSNQEDMYVLNIPPSEFAKVIIETKEEERNGDE